MAAAASDGSNPATGVSGGGAPLVPTVTVTVEGWSDAEPGIGSRTETVVFDKVDISAHSTTSASQFGELCTKAARGMCKPEHLQGALGWGVRPTKVVVVKGFIKLEAESWAGNNKEIVSTEIPLWTA